MKKYLIIGLVSACAVFLTAPAFAGTLSLGLQGQYVTWDSGLAKMNTQAVNNQLQKEMTQGVSLGDVASIEGLDVGDPEITGFLAGPRISYETDDKKWNFRLTSMLYGNYSVTVDTSVMVTADFSGFLPDIKTTIPISTELEIEYRDLDFRTTRMLTENIGVFGGAIYQSYSSELEADYSFPLQNDTMTSSIKFKLDSWMAMLYAGLSYRRDLGTTFSFTGNIGAGLPVAGAVEQDLTVSGTFFNNDITNDGGEFKMAYIMFGEIALGMKLGERVALELGYQYRRMTVKVEKLDLNADGNADESAEETDVYQGVTFAASYLLNL